MKLFFDENLSPALVGQLNQQYPGSSHVRDANMIGTTDNRIWNYCKRHSFIIVSKDNDFRERSFTEGIPPKVIWLNVGNAGTTKIAHLLHQETSQASRRPRDVGQGSQPARECPQKTSAPCMTLESRETISLCFILP